MRRIRFSPALSISVVALFFALGGTSFALTTKSAPQPRCATGAVRAMAEINPSFDLSSLTTNLQAWPAAFNYAWSCTGGKVYIRKNDNGIDVLFVGNPASEAVVSGTDGGWPFAGSVTHESGGWFHVTMGGSNADALGPWQIQNFAPFVIVAF
ncbi:MAG: hypothetical protein JOY72_02875 [Actinobacteria bacterium]|nr:hypothetical protein [Actinomycetota bacterium]MBV8479226.1 hypothetical protein [Actinomycetota bacterium]